MNQETIDYIHAMLSSKVGALLNSGLKSAGAVDEMETASTALIEFARNSKRQTNDDQGSAAFTALDVVVSGRPHLDDLDRFLEKGNGKGTGPHTVIKKLIAVANSVQPVPPSPPAIPSPGPQDDHDA